MTHLHQPIAKINDPDFDIEDGFCSRINKIKGVAALLIASFEADEHYLLSYEGNYGICSVLHDSAEELLEICLKMLKNQEVSK